MSRSNQYALAQLQRQHDLKDMQKEQDGYCPNFNDWVAKLEADPDYLAKNEKRLDDELGRDRLI